jgi:aryl-alcohol dehydrogenase-like predicted oxidoreductase
MSDKTNFLLSKMVIGTAQFGLDYGFNAATARKVTQEECNEMLDISHANGISMLDTAEAYGDAIEKIAAYHATHGQKFEVISKFLTPDNILKPLRDSLQKLAIDSYHTILAHKSQDLFSNKVVQNDLTELKNAGQTKFLGVSIYTNEEFQQAIDCEFVDVIQFPFNLLDNMNQRGELMLKAKKAGKILHTRSVYLQGMFLKEFPLPVKLKPLESYLQKLRDLCLDNDISMTSLCLEYVFNNELIENVIVGQHKSAQLKSNVDMIKNFKGGAYLKEVENILVKEAELLSPRNW